MFTKFLDCTVGYFLSYYYRDTIYSLYKLLLIKKYTTMIGSLLFILLSLGDLAVKSTEGCENIEIVSRAEWGARESLSNETMVTPVPHLFIHHTAMSECDNFASCSQMMRTIQNFHIDDRGWDDIGYNFLIGGDGRVYMGRGWDRVGAHTYGFNRIAVAFSLMGDFSHKLPSELMLNATTNLIECAKNENHVVANYKLHGHRDAGCTECPGSAFYNLIKTWPHFEGGPIPGYKCH
ncbi:peptidoglycan recognition protein 1 [Trichonephila inaurata madagascariensis]|uniref:Peptidoglycan recognition protein 1 n=1 Tax=Trichonephila inaurata madagascariensis TaxID=2747483 RepID=A0A8X6X026_9ARAC|nr:peptidoglycan recognition protein 1 [Trichonephila inaurata madagascariensis]